MKKKKITAIHTPLVLAILDGWGIGPSNDHTNPLLVAKTPFLHHLQKHYPYAELKAYGQYVGLPVGQDGNSEAGHLNIGAGRIVEQDAVIITKAIANGTFFKNPALIQAVNHVRAHHSNLHLMGLLSNYNSGHSSPNHFQALLKFCQQQKISRVFIHFFTDGRDSPKYDASKFLYEAQKRFRNGEVVASIVGRFYAMDRKKNWLRTEKTYNLLTLGEGLTSPDAATAIRHAYNRGESDEFISPTVMVDKRNKPVGIIKDKDAVIFFNLRSDRARQMSKPFVQPNFEKLNPGSFKRHKVFAKLQFVAMTDFGPDLSKITTVYPSIKLTGTLPMALAGLRQLYISEMEKYAHVTYFLNGGYADPVAGEQRVIVPSPSVSSYEKTPAMSAVKVTKFITKALKTKRFDFITVNYPNPDMVAHTGNFQASVQAMEVIDKCLMLICQSLKSNNGSLLVTADHGNVEELIDSKTGEINTDHSTNRVPCILAARGLVGKKFKRRYGVLGDIAPTILEWLKISKPKEMIGHSLLVGKYE